MEPITNIKDNIMINKLKTTLTNTTIQKDDQEFITDIAILLKYITIYILPIIAGLFIWNYLLSGLGSKDGIYYALYLLINNAYRLSLTVFCLAITIDILFAIFTSILIYRKKD